MEVIRSEKFQFLAKMASNSWCLSGLFWTFLTFFSQSSLMDFLFNKQIDPIFWVECRIT